MRRFEQGQEVNGRYRLIAKIGSGGMADVWVATDQMLDRRVALKFLHERFAQDQQFVERFRREATAAAGLQHPNVVGVYDRGEWEGSHYIAMEFVEGASLKDLIERGLSVGEAVEITRQILAGARFAHERGIVHRDLKPGNVMVDAEGRARVTDFGIARAGASEITQTGSVLGTAHYLSPEQAQGLDVTSSSDLYSVGVILYEALTGRVPFDGDSAVTIALKQVSEQPRPPSELNSSVTPALDAVVLRALAKDPANRFASADEFSRALDAAEADPSGGSLGDTASYAAVAAAGAAGAGAAIAAGADPAEAAMASEQEAAHEGDDGGWMTRRRALVIGAILLLLGGVAAFALTRPDTVGVPNVTGKTRAEAHRILQAKGFEVNSEARPFCTEAGLVVEQSPRDGENADQGSTVTITISTGQKVTVPKVAGLPLAQARTKIDGARLELKGLREKFSSQAKPGQAVGSVPPRGTSVDCGSPVTLLVSKGTNVIELPDVIGQQEVDAKAELERLGFIVDVDERDADQPEGEVIGQDPGPGSRLKKGSTVSIIVSTGAGSVIVPGVEGLTRSAAVANLTSRGLNVSIDEAPTTDPSEDGRVIGQAPSAGTRVRSGDEVTIVVGVLKQPPTTTPTTSTTPKSPTRPAVGR
ncbi:MAG: Stk1 family PASTA domain-containing Ser/Thr kinase [bacterium]